MHAQGSLGRGKELELVPDNALTTFRHEINDDLRGVYLGERQSTAVGGLSSSHRLLFFQL